MGHSDASSEKLALSQDVLPLDDFEAAGTRVVAFNPQEHGEIHEEKVHYGHPRSRGVEMKREMTKEDMELAAAGYEHLEELKTKAKTGDQDGLDKVDIVEHHLNFDELRKDLDTQIDVKDPGGSYGLTAEQAKERLTRDGPNILTPPKKKSALRKVIWLPKRATPGLTTLLQYIDCLLTMFNILLIVAGILEYVLLGIDFKVGSCTSDARRSFIDSCYRIASPIHTSGEFSLQLLFSMHSSSSTNCRSQRRS